MNLTETKLQNVMEELRMARDEIKRLKAERKECVIKTDLNNIVDEQANNIVGDTYERLD